MKIGIFSIPAIKLAKYNVKDPRLDQVDKLSLTKKKTYAQVELVGQEAIVETDAILVFKDSRLDLILKDLEFLETRLNRATEEPEKILLSKLKGILEKEEIISQALLSAEEKEAISNYGLLTAKPIIEIEEKDLQDLDTLLLKCIQESGFISFFTATGQNESRAWLIKKGRTAWEAAGLIHSDIQRGFIRAEIISFNDLIQSAGQQQAKQAGKMHLEQKDYIMQDGDLASFRFNK